MGIPSGWELVLLLGVLVVLFGATKLPTAARSIGQSMRIFKAEVRAKDDAPEPPQQPSSLPPPGPTGTRVGESWSEEARGEKPQRHDDTIR